MSFYNRLRFPLFLAVILLALSCRNPFHPPLQEPVDTDPEEVLCRNPRELLENLQLAYSERNINIYKALLSEDFRFELISSEVDQIGTDMTGDGIPDSWWGYDQEVQYTQNLFKEGSSDSVHQPPDELDLRLTIPPETNWESDPELGHEDWWIIPCGFLLRLTFYENNSVLSASGVARFSVKPEGDRWYIAVWRDESNL
ncbi:MAG: hypothetical protein BWX75_01390 [Candidatus Cloacimonetes bacterium ADurb.Bin088]|nr:MAG: hypothetical protein BWX75_01390 [Candidatus Cloacimonetes bacterium ADurb.Bin088]